MTARDLALYLHAACFSPTKDTFLTAIQKNHFLGWPGLTSSLIRKHLPVTTATIKGHLRQEQQGLQSTKHSTRFFDDDMYPLPPSTNIKTHDVIYALTNKHGKAYMDITGRFPYASSRGHEYILIAYHYDSNAILGLPLKNRQSATITHAWEQLHNLFHNTATSPNIWILDNESSQELKNAMFKHKTTYQLVPPHTHRANSAERAIQTFKAHFIAGLCSLDPDFPINEWDRLLPQAFLTLNLLQTARANPSLSAHTYLFGNFDFNSTPLAPPGTKVMVHLKPNVRSTWDSRAKDGWYIGPSMHHYRCVRCYLPATRREVDTDTVTFLPKHIKFPEVHLHDFLHQAATDILSLIHNSPSTTVPSLAQGDETKNALLQIACLLNRNNNSIATLNNIKQDFQQALHKYIHEQISSNLIKTYKNIIEKLTITTNPNLKIPTSTKTSQPPNHPPTTPSPVLVSTNTPHLPSLQNTLAPLARVPKTPIQRHQNPVTYHIYDSTGKKQTLDHLLNGTDQHIWQQSASNEFGRLAQGNTVGIKGTNTIQFISKSQLPHDAKITYASFVCDIRPLKQETHSVRMVVGGDKLTYHEDTGSPAASLLETKILGNSVISDAAKGAQFLTCDLKDFFLATPMAKPEFMKIPLRVIPSDIQQQYHLSELQHNNYVFIKIQKGMYGLKQAAILAYNKLVTHLAKYGYHPIPHTVGLWAHKTKPTKFCLCVDDFGVKYYTKTDGLHLLNALQDKYVTSIDWTGSHFCGLHLEWNYDKQFINVSMPHYITNLLQKHNYAPKLPQYSPYPVAPFTIPTKGQRQYATIPDESPKLNKENTKKVQSIVGSLLYYARSIDCTLFPALNTMATNQAAPTENSLRQCHRLLDYIATYPNVTIQFHASNMQLHVDSDAAYLVAPKARSRIAGYFSLESHQPNPTPHGPILVECRTLRHVVASSAEAEIAGIFHNAQIAIPIRYMLQQLGHPQPRTPIKTDNATASSFVKDNITQKWSKSWDMRYYWLRDKIAQAMFKIDWASGKSNAADYFTKHFPGTYHRAIRKKYVLDNTPSLHARVC